VSPSINFHREGEGPPLVLLHGVGHHWQAWQPVIALLADEFDVIACDVPGFGRSAALAASLEPTVAAYVDAFEWFFAELGLERPHVAGSSMGGAIGLELARDRSVGSVSAFSPIGFWTRAERRYCQLSLGAIARIPAAARPALEAAVRSPRGRSAVFWQLCGHPARVPAEEAVAALRDALSAPAFKATLDAFSHYRLTSAEHLRSTPVTIAWGRRDLLLPCRLQAPRARALLPWATHVTLDTGHLPFHDDPAAVAGVIRARARSASDVDARASRGAGA